MSNGEASRAAAPPSETPITPIGSPGCSRRANSTAARTSCRSRCPTVIASPVLSPCAWRSIITVAYPESWSNRARSNIDRREPRMPWINTITPLLKSGWVCQPEITEPESLLTVNAVAFSSRGGSPTTQGFGETSAPATNQDTKNTTTIKQDAPIIAPRIIRLRRVAGINVAVSLSSER